MFRYRYNTLSPRQLAEHEAQVHLLKIYCSILSITLTDSWQVKAQWLSLGEEITTDEGTVALPHSISKILKIISRKPSRSHISTVHEIQKVARSYESDWYTWGRNQLPFFASAPAVKTVLS